MVEIFKTNITDGVQAGFILQLLKEQWPQYKANFDLEDCDRILRIESDSVENEKILSLMNLQGYLCEVLN
jgi:hypothetical protein